MPLLRPLFLRILLPLFLHLVVAAVALLAERAFLALCQPFRENARARTALKMVVVMAAVGDVTH